MVKHTIKIADKFVWKILTYEQAHSIFMLNLFPIYSLQDGQLEELVGDLDHLEELSSNDEIQLAIEVGYTDYQEVAELKRRIKSHDFAYEFSDDSSLYRKGVNNLCKILELSTLVPREDYIKWWNRSAPERFQFIR